jgi:hypothetical protein
MTTADVATLGAILLASIAAQAPAASDCTPTVDADARNAVLGKLASRLEADYAVPQTATKLAQAVRDKQKLDAYGNITCAPELARRLTEDLYAIAHDRHLRVNYSFGPVPEGRSGPPTAEEIQQMRKLNGMIPNVEILDGNVGYIRVNGVPPIAAARDAVAAAFAFVHGTDALIIDDRENHGGDPNTVALYMSYLSAGPPYVVNTFHWRTGPHRAVRDYGPRRARLWCPQASVRTHFTRNIFRRRGACLRLADVLIGEHFLDHTPKKTFDSDHYGQGD